MPFFTIVQENFPFPELLQLFFDGKQREDVTTGIKKEGIAVAVCGPGMEKEKFLGNKSVDKGTGLACGGAVIDIVIDWKLRGSIKALSYDTCPINTGLDNGEGTFTASCILTRIRRVFGLVKSQYDFRCMRVH